MKTDSELSTDIQAEFDWDPRFDDRGIVVVVKDGVVTLAGHVSTYPEKWAAESAAKGIAGVHAVANDIEVRPGEAAERSDTDIAQAAIVALKANVSVPTSGVQVTVNDGCIVLEGQVSLWFQKDAAEAALRNLRGVRAIRNRIEIRPRLHSGDIKGKIRQTFKRHADLDADKVNVVIADGTVGRIASERGGAFSARHRWRDNVIATGGGPGLMEAANRGACEAGAATIGFNIRLPSEQQPNPYTTPELTFRFHYFAMRKMHLAMRANALAIFPGGFGTLDELFEILTLRQTNKAPPIPIMLFDRAYWERVIGFAELAEQGMVSPHELSLFDFAESAEALWTAMIERGLRVDGKVE